MVLLSTLAGGAATYSYAMLQYNRENFMFEKGQTQERTYMGQEMYVKQWELFREDVRDLVDLTCQKMDCYTVVNALLVTFCVLLMTEGAPKKATNVPYWTVFLYAMSIAGALLYFLLSLWLAMHASIAAHAYGVRLLTQTVRLPVPDKEQIDAGRAKAADFEGSNPVSSILRLPVWERQMGRLAAVMTQVMDEDNRGDEHNESNAELNTEGEMPLARSQEMSKHIKMYREMQHNWQAYDAYARVCMTLGMNQLLHALNYYVLTMLFIEQEAPLPALACTIVFIAAMIVIARLDLYLSRRALMSAALLLFAGPGLNFLAVTIKFLKSTQAVQAMLLSVMVPLNHFTHTAWLVVLVWCARPEEIGQITLPTSFRSVLYLDVFGWSNEKGNDQPDVDPPSVVQSVTQRLFSRATPSAHSARVPRLGDGSMARLFRGSSMHSLDSPPDNHQELMYQGSQTASSTGQFRPMPLNNPLPGNLQSTLLATCQDLRVQLHQNLSFWESDGVKAVLSENSRVTSMVQRMRTQFQRVAKHIPAPAEGEQEPKVDEHRIRRLWLLLEVQTSTGAPLELYYHCATGQNLWSRPTHSHVLLDIQSMVMQVKVFTNKVRGLVDSGSLTSGTFLGSFERNMRKDATERRRNPGQMPWRTVRLGSIVLIAMWTVSIIWSIVYEILHVQAPFHPPQEDKEQLPQLLIDDNWPHTFFAPRGIACHPALGGRIFFVERYGVHELRVDTQGENELQPALAQCLEHNIDFLAAGIDGISVECSQGESLEPICDAVLVGSPGNSLLRCSLHEGQKFGHRLPLVGGEDWHSVVAGDGSVFFALRNTTVAQFGPRWSSGRPLPQFELPVVAPQDVKLLVLGRKAVLGLEKDGTLHGWSITGKPTEHWHLPKTSHWTDMCHNGDAFYFIGTHKRSGDVGLWKLTLPVE